MKLNDGMIYLGSDLDLGWNLHEDDTGWHRLVLSDPVRDYVVGW